MAPRSLVITPEDFGFLTVALIETTELLRLEPPCVCRHAYDQKWSKGQKGSALAQKGNSELYLALAEVDVLDAAADRLGWFGILQICIRWH